MIPADPEVLVREFAARLAKLGDGDPSALHAEIDAAGLTSEVLDLLDRQAQAYVDHSAALKREWRDRIVRAVK